MFSNSTRDAFRSDSGSYFAPLNAFLTLFSRHVSLWRRKSLELFKQLSVSRNEIRIEFTENGFSDIELQSPCNYRPFVARYQLNSSVSVTTDYTWIPYVRYSGCVISVFVSFFIPTSLRNIFMFRIWDNKISSFFRSSVCVCILE